VVAEFGRRRTSSLGRFAVAVLSLLLGVIAFAAHPAAAHAPTTTSGAATYTYDTRTSTHVDNCAIDVACAATTQLGEAREGSASPPVEARGTSTTRFAPVVATNTADDLVDLASPARRTHILDGDATGGGHRWPGQPDKTPFPKSWTDDEIMHADSDIATDPSLQWNWTKGGPNGYTRAGDPARAEVFGVRNGLCVKAVVEPAGEGIITAHQSPGSC
jgi:Bacterial EndoU nuclease